MEMEILEKTRDMEVDESILQGLADKWFAPELRAFLRYVLCLHSLEWCSAD